MTTQWIHRQHINIKFQCVLYWPMGTLLWRTKTPKNVHFGATTLCLGHSWIRPCGISIDSSRHHWVSGTPVNLTRSQWPFLSLSRFTTFSTCLACCGGFAWGCSGALGTLSSLTFWSSKSAIILLLCLPQCTKLSQLYLLFHGEVATYTINLKAIWFHVFHTSGI